MAQRKRGIVRRLRGKKPAPPAIRLSPRQEKQLVRKVAAQMPGAQVPLQGVVLPHGANLANAAGRAHVFRWRRQLAVFYWLTAMLGAGFGFHAAHARHGIIVAGLLGAGAAIVMVLLCRHLEAWTRTAVQVMAACTAVCLPLIAAFGRPCAALFVACWAVVAWKWCIHYRVRPEAAPAQPDVTDYDTWNLLAAERKWNALLGTVEALPGGGRRYPIQCDGVKTVMGPVLSASEHVAGAWHKPITEAYAERDPAGVTSRGYLTILGRETLMKVRHWDGAGIDPQTGMAVIGRYADGSPVHVKFYTPRYGTRHALISGTTGSGKSQLLDLLIFTALTSPLPFVPVVLDPQEGQSLPFWRDRVLYAAGPDECLTMLDGLRAGMLDRSSYLAGLRWEDDGIPMRGMPTFDYELTGLPMPLVIFDEAHMLLTDPGKAGQRAVACSEDMGRLGRKTGTLEVLATHIPSLADLGGSQALRDMLRGGNVVSMRTANRVAGGMLGLAKDPSEIPMFFADGKETYGLGLAAGPDNRPDAPMRSDLVPKAMRRKVPAVPELDDRFREAMERAMDKRRVASVVTPAALGPSLAAVPAADDDDADAPEGRRCSDAVLAVLKSDMTRGEIIRAAKILVTQEWGRPKPFSVRAIGDALRALAAENRIAKPADGTYAPLKPSLTVLQ